MKVSQALHSKGVLVHFLIAFGLLVQVSPGFCGGVVTTFTPAALQTALAGGGTVTFGGNGTITLSSALTITQDTTLDANGHQVTISGGNAVRLFTVTDANFRVNGLTLADGRVVGASGAVSGAAGQDAVGACLLNQGGTISLTACTLTNHVATGGNAGSSVGAAGRGLGGALCSFGGQINLTNCLVENCSAQGGVGTSNAVACGGALYLAGGSLNLQGTTLSANSASGGVGASSPAADAFGGAIYATSSAQVNAGSSVLTGNVAVGGAADAGNGGALCLAGGSLGVFTGCVFSANYTTSPSQVPPSPSGSAYGGAVFNQAEFRASRCSFSGNYVRAGGGVPGAAAGGALYSTATLRIEACTFDHNLAQGGAGYYHSPVQYWNGGTAEGGAIWSMGLLAATNSTWAANQAVGGPFPQPPPGIDGPAHGGGLCISAGTATLANITMAGNYATLTPYTHSGTLNLDFVGIHGGNLFNLNGSVAVWNSVFAYGTASLVTDYGTTVPCGSNIWGTVTDDGYNLSSDTTGGFTAAGSVTNTDPLLSGLGNHGGPTATLWLLPGSPARDQIPSGFPMIDQRGAPRPQGAAADMGAVEANDPPAAPFAVLLGQAGNNLALTFNATDTWRAYRLLTSSDLVAWTSIATNSPLSAGPVQFSQPLSGTRRFFRVVTP